MVDSVTADRRRMIAWAGWVVLALLILPFAGGWAYFAVVAVSALVLMTVPGARPQPSGAGVNRSVLVVIGAMYLAVVLLMRLAFVGFGVDRTLGLFLSFGAALLLGTVGPAVHAVRHQGRSLRSLGVRTDNLRTTVVLGLVFASVQFALTLWDYDLPNPEDWVPLLVMALVVGMFESVFFRGFIQNRLAEQFGPAIGVSGAAIAYGLYHVGYGMGLTEIGFLTGLGAVYSVAFALTRNVLVLWPLLTPLGSFYANVTAGDIDLPWASVLGFADVAALMVAAYWIVARAHRRQVARATASSSSRSREPEGSPKPVHGEGPE
jgi:membrane protease YdiL (CAAX protease family)